MKNLYELHHYQSPTRLVHGINILNQLPEEVAALGIKKPLLVTSPPIVECGLLAKIEEPLREAGIGYVIFDGISGEPTCEDIAEGSKVYRESGCDGMIAAGGGAAIDSAKAIGVEIAEGGPILDYECAPGKKPLTKRIPPLIAVPTTAGTGSEVTLWSVIKDTKREYKFNVGGVMIAAHVAFIDPSLHVSLPADFTAGTGMDALCHAIECYTCAYAQPITDCYALYAIELAGKYLRRAVACGTDLEARYGMALCAMFAGATYGTDSAGAVHALTQTLGGIFPIPHGKAVAATLVPVMEFNWMGEPEKYRKIAEALGEDTSGLTEAEGARRAVDAVYKLACDIGIQSLAEFGVKEGDIPRLAQAAFDDPQTVGNPRDLTVDAYVRIYKRALSIQY